MKKSFLFTLVCLISFSVAAQENEPKEGYQFEVIKELPVTSVKDQNSTGTCWCFSALSFLESEIIRNGYKGEIDLSEMFIVSRAYSDKAEKYVRLNGHLNLAPGSSFTDAIIVYKNYGIVPNSVMPGLEYGEDNHNHGEMDAAIKGYTQALLRKPMGGKLSTAWKDGVEGILAAYLGEVPETFVYEGQEYTPITYAASLGINPDDYISITSFTHHPFYTQFAIEVPDNWRWDLSYNVPLDEMMEIMYNAIEEGYTIAWASDVSEQGFTRNGVAVNPDIDVVIGEGSDKERWLGLSRADKQAEIMKLVNSPSKEVVVTQELRQKDFDNGKTTDDHGMHIYGLAKDQNGTKYFMVKNSWGESGKYKGHWYASESFVMHKTLNIVVHKNAIPKDIRKKLGIK